ncbi:MAG: hypothetical protein Fues2KO_02190 [Fuerstiella sp.]
MPDWDRGSRQLHENVISALRSARDSAQQKDAPSLDLVREWHRLLMAGLKPTGGAKTSWFGQFRGEPGQESVRMKVQSVEAPAPNQVTALLKDFIETLSEGIVRFDDEIPSATDSKVPGLSRGTVLAIIGLMAFAHGEWIRIHPFANGNGRTARLWANWIAMRYGLPPFVAVRPRPRAAYETAARKSMKGDWRAMRPVFEQMLHEFAVDVLTGQP